MDLITIILRAVMNDIYSATCSKVFFLVLAVIISGNLSAQSKDELGHPQYFQQNNGQK